MRGSPTRCPFAPSHCEMPLGHLQNAGLICGSGSLLR